MKNILLILGLIITCMVVNAIEITIKKLAANQTIYIDGDDSDWPETITFQAVDQNKGLQSDYNNTTSFKMTYDDKFVYVVAKVWDATLDTSQSANVWEKDCIEVFFVLNDTILDGTILFNSSIWGMANEKSLWP